jgi:hypothetical protein
LVWVAFSFWGLKCLLIEEKKGSDKENLLLPILIRHFEKLALGCFSILGLEMSAD